ncbi:MAG TPA: UDP-N-acetylmuramoyl-L-alanine--D-glutamate ligase [Acidimicrobiia bacterium]|nr:UDP-N-acetylmuramoyl-L-alanine--D-glutamate ligase [Acidimicrobiia bacterium]
MRVLVVGLGATGDAVVRYVRGRGDDVTVVDDRPLDARAEYARVEDARRAGAEVLAPADAATVERLAVGADLVVPSPGVPERHVALQAALAAGVAVRSEVDLAAALTAPTDPSGPRLAAITGTNGKTTVTTLTAAMLDASGVRSLAAGNIGLPLLDAARSRVDVVVAEVSSFQLVFTTPAFRPAAAALLNVADDHLDWHRTFDAYARAKARIFEHQGADDLLVFNADDPAVAALAADAPGRRVPFSVGGSAASGFRVVDGASGRMLVTGDGTELVALGDLTHRAPHDLANALAAAAVALETGATIAGVRDALRSFRGLAHRLQLVGERDGVTYFDDSKATNLHATVAAVRGFDSVVLIAGGRNKGLDLGGLAEVATRLRAAIAIGDAADEVTAALHDRVPVVTAHTMREAVRAASEIAEPGDAVLLSPACASFDWYEGYAARGDDFAREVAALIGATR